jgi:hypothetical protein
MNVSEGISSCSSLEHLHLNSIFINHGSREESSKELWINLQITAPLYWLPMMPPPGTKEQDHSITFNI